MNRLNLLFSKLAFSAILLLLVSSSTVYAQVSYALTGTLSLVSGPDVLGLNGLTVMAVATMNQTLTPSTSSTSAISSTNSYVGVTGVTLDGAPCASTSPVTVTLTDNVGAPDTIAVSDCEIQSALVSASATIPDGNMITAVPSAIPLTSLTSGTVTYTINGGTPTVFNFTDGTIFATGTAPPTATPSLTSWTPAAAGGSTTALTQNVTLSAPAPVSFTTSATTTSGGNWLAVTPSAANTSSAITLYANPSGLGGGSYSGTVTLNYGGDVTPTQIAVTFTISGASTTLTATASMTFNYTSGGTPPASQQLAIGAGSATNVNVAVTAGNTWLSVSPATGTTPASFTVSVNTSGITTSQTGNIQITATGVSNSPLNVPVALNVSSSTLTVPSTPLTFTYTIGGSAPAAQPVSITGTSGIAFTTSTGAASWLSATASGTVPSSISVSVNAGTLTAGTYNGTVTVTSTGAAGSPAAIPVTLNVIAPALSASPSQLNFTYQLGSAQPAAQPVSITGTSGVAFTTSTGAASWLSATARGTVPSSISVSVNAATLTAGTYNGTVTITSTGAAPQVVNVSLVVTMPTVTAGSASLNFAYQVGTTAPAAQSLAIGGTSGLAFTATAAGGSWLSVSPSSGIVSSSSSVSVSVNPSGLAANTYHATVTVAAPGATSQVVNVTLVVSTTPALSASPSLLSFTYQLGGAAPVAQSVNIGGSSGLAFTATAAGGSWLSVNPGSGTTPGSVSVSVNPSGLAAKTYNGTVTIAATGTTSQVVNVTLVVSNTPTITASPSSLSFSYTLGSTVPVPQTLNVGGASGLSYTAAAGVGSSWLALTPGTGTLPSALGVGVNPGGLTVGTYHGSVAITVPGASNSPFTVPVTLTVTGTAATISLSASTLNFSATTAGSPPLSEAVNVTSTAASPVSVATSGGAWLSASLSASTTPAVLTVSANQTNLAVGTYTGAVVVTSPGASNTPLTIAVQFVVSLNTTLSATPASLSFAYVLGNANPAVQSVNITSSEPLTFATSVANGSWLTVASTGSSTPATLTVSVNASSLATGTYNTTISIASAGAANSPLIVPVALVVSNKPTLAASPTSLVFSAQAGAANPASQSINLSGSSTLPISIATSPGWLNVSAASGTTPATLVATVNSQGMSQGSYQGAITVTSAVAGNSPTTIPVTLSITAPLVVTGPTISNIVSAASYDASGFSPGAIVTIFGSLLGPQTGSVFSVNSNGGLDNALAGVTVTVAGVPAIPLFVQNGQINIILPYSLGTAGQATVEVQYNNQTSTGFNIPLTAADVQIFTANASGSGPGSILNQDYSVNTATNPAAPGSVVSVYGTGGGALTPPVTAGGVAGDALSWVALPYSATVNGEDATVLYAGSAPSLVYGVYQFNVQLPADLPAGAATIVLKVGDSASQSDVTVFVK